MCGVGSQKRAWSFEGGTTCDDDFMGARAVSARALPTLPARGCPFGFSSRLPWRLRLAQAQGPLIQVATRVGRERVRALLGAARLIPPLGAGRGGTSKLRALQRFHWEQAVVVPPGVSTHRFSAALLACVLILNLPSDTSALPQFERYLSATRGKLGT